VFIEFGKLFSQNPVLAMNAGTCRLDRELSYIVRLYLEPQYVALPTISGIPIASDLDCVFLFKLWVENWLLWKTRRGTLPIRWTE
jgi:hypothetical protein